MPNRMYVFIRIHASTTYIHYHTIEVLEYMDITVLCVCDVLYNVYLYHSYGDLCLALHTINTL